MSGIEWTTKTWNPTIGCQRVSAGCENCYAERTAAQRLEPNPSAPSYDGIAERTEAGPRWTGEVKCLPGKLDEPLSWRKPRRVFVDSMSDLFHPDVPFEFIAAVFGVMAAAPRHTFQVLTKRPERMRAFFEWIDHEVFGEMQIGSCNAASMYSYAVDTGYLDSQPVDNVPGYDPGWPLPNCWIGVSCEDQDAADERIPPLLECPAAVRFVSAEPLLGPIELKKRWLADVSYVCDACGASSDRFEHEASPSVCCGGEIQSYDVASISWIIVGGESGPEARPCKLEWIDGIIEQCHEAGVPAFVKQLGAEPLVQTRDAMHPAHPPYTEFYLDHSKGADPSEWPEGLRVREFPEGATDAD